MAAPVKVVVRVLHPPQCQLERLQDDEAGQARVGCEVTAGLPPLQNFSWSPEGRVTTSNNYSVMTLLSTSSSSSSTSTSLLQPTKIRCTVTNTVGRGECDITLPASLSVLNHTTSLILFLVIPAILVIVITSLAIIFCLNKLSTSNQKYFVSGRS